MRHLITTVAVLFACAACGAKGPLERPAGPVPPPLFGNTANQPSSNDVSTAPDTQ